jgi:nitrogen regulation protein NR(I)
MPLLLVVDDEPNIAYTIAETLGTAELKINSAGTARDGLEAVRRERPDAVLLDVRLPDMSGLDAFQRIHEIDPRIPVIIMTAFAKTDTAIEAMSRGAFDYFVKPVDFAALRQAVNRAIDVSRLNHVPAVVEADEESLDVDHIVGRSTAMQEVYKTIGRVAQQDVTVLIVAESGTGKELVARAIYHYSRRSKQPFLAVNCAALSESLLESELFGHEKGAFTGADQRRIGKFEQVNGGTIFLDEIGDMSPSTQAKALRLLQEQQFERVGGNTTIQTDVRIIAATNKDLGALAAAGQFRQDLFYRLNGFTVSLPPVRERKEDIPILAEHFRKRFNRDLSRNVISITADALAALEAHDWPGNVRELQSAIKYAMVQAAGDVITPDCLPESCLKSTLSVAARSVGSSDAPPSLGSSDLQRLVQQHLADGTPDLYRHLTSVFDRIILSEVMQQVRGNQVQAADRLGISRMTLRNKLRHLGLLPGTEDFED